METAFNWDAIPAFLRSGPDGYAEGITGTLAILKLDVGYLVGQNGGEWGGWLRWYSDDGSHTHLILQENTSSTTYRRPDRRNYERSRRLELARSPSYVGKEQRRPVVRNRDHRATGLAEVRQRHRE
jgi:hypothetical protein